MKGRQIMMEKNFCFFLAAILLASALVSCAAPSSTAAIGANIRLTSSDGESAALWLTERLGERLTDRVVLGTEADGCGVDLSSLEDDGYFIRDLGSETALFARTTDGLDRAVRRYAKAVESGAAITDVTYHEGARVKKLTIAGRDISEYAIYCEDEQYMKKYAADFASLIQKATGADLAISTEAPSSPYIALRYADDGALGNVGYRWSVSEEGLTLECSGAYKVTSVRYAVRRFLQDALDWYGLDFGFEDLPAADRIEIEAGESGGETPCFDWALVYGGQYCKYDQYDNNVQNVGLDRHSCHGISNHGFAGELSNSPDHNWSADMPCWIDEEFYEVSLNDIEAYIVNSINAGRTPEFIDVAAGDNAFWCECKNCAALLKQEGSYSAHVLTWVNRLSEELGEKYPGIYYGVFAYAGSNRPPKTLEAGDHVCVTFCFDRNCSAHPLDGSRCTWGDPSPGRKFAPRDNPTYATYVRKWGEICDNVYVWYYGLPNGLLTMSYVHNVRDDWRFLNDIGVKGVFWEAEAPGYDANFIAYQLAAELLWDIDMSDEKYDALYDRILAATYGEEGAPLIKEYVKVIDRVYEASRCQSCWAFGKLTLSNPSIMYSLDVDPGGIADHYDLMFDLVEAAYRTAPDARREMRLTALEASVIYKGSVAAYPTEQAEGDDERMAQLSSRYRLMVTRLAEHGVDLTAAGAIDNVFLGGTSYPATLEELYPEGENREKYIEPIPFH